MSLHLGYNIVTECVADTESKLGALDFFRKRAADKEVESPVTVTGLEDLLYVAEENKWSNILGEARQTLRKTQSLGTMDAVQFVIVSASQAVARKYSSIRSLSFSMVRVAQRAPAIRV